MTSKELKTIGKETARELYRLLRENGVPDNDLITTKQACEITGKSRQWLYNHSKDIPHRKGMYSRKGLEYFFKER